MKPSEWGQKQEQTDDSGSGLIVNKVENPAGAQLVSSVISEEDYSDYGISAQVEGAVMLSITNIQPSYATNTKFRWSASFITPSSGWAYGKNVSSYVNVAPATDTLSAVVTCLQAFGARIWVKAYCESNPNVVLTCEFDYMAKFSTPEVAVINVYPQASSTPTNILSFYTTGYTYKPYFNANMTEGTIKPEIVLGSSYKIEIGQGVQSYPNVMRTWRDSKMLRAYEHPNDGTTFTANRAFMNKFFCVSNIPDSETRYSNDLIAGIRYMDQNSSAWSNVYVGKDFTISIDYEIKLNGQVLSSGTAVGYLGAAIASSF